MKTKSLQIILITTALFFVAPGFAQYINLTAEKNNYYSYADFSKTSPLISSTNKSVATEAISYKVGNSFKKYFGDQAEQNWSMVGNDFLNRFHVNGVLVNSMFDKRGNLIYTITYGTE